MSLILPSRYPAFPERWRWPAFVAILVLGANFTSARMLNVIPPCPLRSLTGWLCPLCGSTRALYHLARGEWRIAWNYNALTMVVGLAWATHVTGRSVWRDRWLTWEPGARLALVIGISVAALAFFVARNFYSAGGGPAGP